GKKCNRRTTTNFKTFGSLRNLIDGVKGRFRGTLSEFGSVAVLRREDLLNFVKHIYVCDNTILEDVGPSEGQINQSLSQVVESFNAHGESDGSSSSFASSERVENDGVAKVQQETDDDYSSINWIDTEEEGEPIVQQGTEPSIQEEVEPSAQENAEEDIDSDSICSDQSIDYESDVHEELRIVKEDMRKFKESRRRKKKEKTKCFLGEVGLDEGYEDIAKGKKKFKGKLTEDESYYDSSECDSFQSDEEEHVSDDELKGGKFNRILDCKDVLLQTNPGSTCVVKLKDSESENEMKQFHSFYLCFDAMKKGFQQGCRRCIGLDGCFLKGICKGQLLHKMCARHILANWSQNFKGIERRKKFWACARSTFEAQFKYNINVLSKLEKGIVETLIKYNKEKWCRAFFQTFSKCDSIDNSMAESFNAWILGPRNKTIITMLEEIRVKVISRVSKSRAFAETWTDGISQMAMMVLNTNVARSMQCNIE
ncbi:hypothetical protein H5410_014126, partial [Solanum commersonii]